MLRLAFIVLMATFAMNGSINAEEKTWLELNEEKKELKKKLLNQISCREKRFNYCLTGRRMYCLNYRIKTIS